MTTSSLKQDIRKEFEEKFVKKVVKQVDTSNSIELPLWKNNHSHLSRDIAEFIDSIIDKCVEETRKEIEKMYMTENPNLLVGRDDVIERLKDL